VRASRALGIRGEAMIHFRIARVRLHLNVAPVMGM
jgi:hypothetical protein